jgi:hypothetical protein
MTARGRPSLDENPFLVLAIATDAPAIAVERAAQRLLAELELGRSTAQEYATPSGLARRTPELVRAAVAELRDPARRLVHELRAKVSVRAEPRAEVGIPWDRAARLLGLRRCS